MIFTYFRCGHCKRLAPTWQDLAVKYNEKFEDEQDVLIGKVDCTQQTALCSSQDVTGYPTLKFFKDGIENGVKHRGQRDLANLVKFIDEQLGNAKPDSVSNCAKKLRLHYISEGKPAGLRRYVVVVRWYHFCLVSAVFLLLRGYSLDRTS